VNYFLAKTDPETYSVDQLEREHKTVWDGVKNSQALRAMASMRPKDSRCGAPWSFDEVLCLYGIFFHNGFLRGGHRSAFPRHRSEARVPIGVIIDSPTSGVLSLADRGLRTTRFETFEILWRSNRESYRKEKEIAGSGRDLQVLAHRPAFELRPL